MPAQNKVQRVERIQGGLNVRTDCFGYDTEKKDCTVMTELLCLRKNVVFTNQKLQMAAVNNEHQH